MNTHEQQHEVEVAFLAAFLAAAGVVVPTTQVRLDVTPTNGVMLRIFELGLSGLNPRYWVQLAPYHTTNGWDFFCSDLDGVWVDAEHYSVQETEVVKVYETLATEALRLGKPACDVLAVFIIAYPVSGAVVKAGLDRLVAGGYNADPIRERLEAFQQRVRAGACT